MIICVGRLRGDSVGCLGQLPVIMVKILRCRCEANKLDLSIGNCAKDPNQNQILRAFYERSFHAFFIIAHFSDEAGSR